MTRNILFIIISAIIFAGCQSGTHPQPCTPKKQSKQLAALTDSLTKSLDWPDDLDINVFSGPDITPDPAVLSVAPTGEVYVGVDKNGSLSVKPGEGKIVRLIDCNHDGIMDSHTVFAKVDDPRGIIAMGSDVFVLHTYFSPKTGKPLGERLVKYEDKNQDGVADGEPAILVRHMSNQKYLTKRGTDHAINGIEMGIDGWIYIAAGDYGFYNAVGSDGTKLTMMGGGVVRVRPDGSEMEVYIHGTRNIYDVAIDPFMNLFARDNTNDGGGWNTRFIHFTQSAEYGYPILFKHFTEEIVPALADLGGGSGTGALYMDDSRWPDKYNDVVLTCDWGRSYLYLNYVTPDKGTFTMKEKKFIEIPQITDVDIDASGTLYLSAWDGAGFKGDPTKGFTVRVVPNGFQPKDFPRLQDASIDKLSEYLKSPNAKARLYAQYELLRRPDEEKAAKVSWNIAANKQLPLDVRVAGLFTYAQITGKNGITNLVQLTHDKSVREFALRALADRKPYVDQVPIEPFLSALNSSSDRVKIAAIVGLGRLGREEAVQPLLQDISVPPSFKAPKPGTIGPHATPNPEIIPPHVAVRALLKIGDTDALLDAVAKDHNKLALWALRYVHKVNVPKRLIHMYKRSNDPKFKNRLLHNLARIYHKEAPYDGTTWWHTRPDTHGPYYNAIDWEGTSIIKKFFINQRQQSSAADKKLFATLNSKYRLSISQFGGVAEDEGEETSKIAKRSNLANNGEAGAEMGEVGKSSVEDVLAAIAKTSGKIAQGKKLFMKLGCHACHNVNGSEVMKGPFLGQIGGIMDRRQIAVAILKPNDTVAQGFVTQLIRTKDGKSYMGFVSRETADKLVIRNALGKPTTIKKSSIVTREGQKFSMMPSGLANRLSYKEFAALVDFLAKHK